MPEVDRLTMGELTGEDLAESLQKQGFSTGELDETGGVVAEDEDLDDEDDAFEPVRKENMI